MYCISFELEGLKQSVTHLIYQKVTYIFFPGRANLSHTQKYQLSKSNRILICNINCSRYANTNCFESINSQLKRQKYTNLNLMVKISIHSTIIPFSFNIMENTYKIFYEKYSQTLPQVIFDLGCKQNVIIENVPIFITFCLQPKSNIT